VVQNLPKEAILRKTVFQPIDSWVGAPEDILPKWPGGSSALAGDFLAKYFFEGAI
jgi:hypothetical protein